MVGVVAYALVDIVLQLLPPHYSPIGEAESNLAVGPFGWIMNLNFLARAALTLCAIVAIVGTGPATRLRATGTALMAIAGACSGALAFFPTDVGGAAGLQAETVHGTVHLGVAALGFLTALAAFMVLTLWMRRRPELTGSYPAALVFVFVAAGGLLCLGVAGGGASNLLGLAERICLLGILGWVFAVCSGIRRLR